MMDEDMDVEKLKEVLSVISTEIPKLIESISKTALSLDSAEKLGQATAAFYKKMREAGMDEKEAYRLTEAFMSNFSVSGMISQVLGSKGKGHYDEDIGEAIREKINKKLREKLNEDD